MRLISTIFFIMFLAFSAFAQPVNDECVDRIQLGVVPLCPVIGTFTNVDATASVISSDPTLNKPACFSGSQPDNDVWFSFEVPADGSAPNLIIEVTPTTGANGPISQPQIAAYRGECGEDELAEIGCASAAFNEDMVILELFGLNAGNEIFLRIEDWTASATPNSGDFELCVKAPDPIFNIGEDDGSMLCSGQLFDSGGADGPYGNSENNQFVICPTANFSCIEIEIPAYDIESGFDELNIFSGSSTSDPLFLSFDGTGGPTSFNISSTCVTVQFTSDGSVTRDGFELNWTCTSGDCENPFSTCGAPTEIMNLPYAESGFSTCGALNAVESGPCNAPGLLAGDDHVFTYASPGNECIMVEVSNANPLTALSIYNNCPEQATECLGSDVSAVGSNAVVMMTYLEEPGLYYIIVDNSDACTDFDIAVNSVTCANDAPVTCDAPIMIGSVPYMDNASTCGATNSEGNNDCSFGSGPGEDYIYAYESIGGECLTVRLENAGFGTTISALDGCSVDDPDCFGFAEVTTGDTAVIQLVRLFDPGTYYFVVEASEGCGSFDLQITSIDCPITLPPAIDCENALNINGCGNQPQIINVDQMPSEDDTAYQPGINDGCWSGTGQARFTWFTFQAQADGNFGFLANNAEDPTASDIDIQVWGPYATDEMRCDVMRTTQPVRSTWDAPNVPNLTGLTDVHPATGVAVTDVCENAGGDADGYVSTIQVQQGEWYLVLVNDFSGTIEEGGINMDFTETTPGVLAEFGQMATISPDTVTCPGSPVMLEAGGGLAFNWINSSDGLNCNTCPTPIATITETTEFSVIVSDACNMDTLTVKVAVLEAMAGADQEACNGEPIELVGRPTGAGTEGFWSENTNALSCINCPNPTVDTELLGPGEFSFVYQVGGLLCSNSDTVVITILDAVAPEYAILADTSSCEELVLSLGGATDPNAGYSWTSNPPGFTSTDANPMVTASETITYYLEVTNQTCPRVIMDSVVVMIGNEASLPTLEDQEICSGTSYFLNGNVQSGVTYSWSPSTGISNPSSIVTSFNPTQTTTYTLTTSQDGCIAETNFTITVIGDTEPTLTVTEDLSACVGTIVNLEAVSNVPGTYQWSDGSTGGSITTDLIEQNISLTVTFTPDGECFPSITETINIMALGTPEIDEFTDQSICSVDGYQLSGLTVQPGVMYNWTPSVGVINPNELNAGFNPTDTTTYQVTGTVGACADTATFTLNVAESPVVTIDPVVAVCPGSDVTLSANATLPGEFIWFPFELMGPEVVIEDVNSSLTFTVVFTADNGCEDAAVVIMEVIDEPVIGALADQLLCTDETYQLSGLTEQPGVIYSWTPATGVADPNALNNTFSPTETTTYQITASAGDCSDTESFTINVAETPVITIDPIDVVCSGSDVTITANASIPGEFTWTPGNLTGSEITINDVNATTVYTAEFLADNGCTEVGMVTMEVIESPVIGTLEDQLFCTNDDTYELSGLVEEPGVTYAWTPAIGVADPSALNNIFSPTVTTTYEITATGVACSETESFTINVEETPVLTVPEMATACIGMSLTLTANSTEPGTFTWNPGNLTGDEVTINNLTEMTIYTVSFEAENGCPVADEQIIVEVVPSVEITEIMVDPEMGIVEGDMIQLAVTTEPDNAIMYNWSSGGTGVTETVIPLEIPQISYGVTVTDSNGCTDEATITVDVEPAQYGIPNAFVPDGQQDINRVFQVEITGGNIDVLSMRIWNRFGELVHEGSGTSHGWDGRIDGKLAPSDVYLYGAEIQLPDGTIEKMQGDLTLIR